MSPEIDKNLQAAAYQAAGTSVRFVRNNPIVEIFQDKIVWEGVVSEFASLDDRTIYVWAVEAAPEQQYVTVLQRPPVKNALDAVRAWILSQRSQ